MLRALELYLVSSKLFKDPRQGRPGMEKDSFFANGGSLLFSARHCKTFLFFQNKHNVTGTGTDLGKQYITFVRSNQDQVGKKITDDLWVLSTMEVNYYFFTLLFPLILYCSVLLK